MTCAREPVFDARRLLPEIVPLNKPAAFKLSQMLGQDLLRDSRHVAQKLGAAHGRLREEPKQDWQFPAAGQHLQYATDMSHGAVRPQASRPVFEFNRHF